MVSVDVCACMRVRTEAAVCLDVGGLEGQGRLAVLHGVDVVVHVAVGGRAVAVEDVRLVVGGGGGGEA
jgi:hypothetical protein